MIVLPQSPTGFFVVVYYFLRRQISLHSCLSLIAYCLLEKVFLEVIIDLGKEFSIAFARHL